jgi:deazaflavin-dependent oxidoreductase (nitroreductase family)
MDPAVSAALDRGGIIDITTTGRRSGEPRRIEIVFHNVGGRIVISGMPMRDRKRAWIHNLEADPRLTIHLKRGVVADLPGTARIVTDEAERRELLVHVARTWSRTDVDAMVAWSPLIEVTVPGYGPPGALRSSGAAA